ncbi:TMEM175 family protein [Herbiconiux sp. 11R-BC]|uniref:TMEM175 family protein n=1 Tax=Herbiconiux sp. 11R-BC TaxID=3111637 RepID=UPI003C069D89
MTASAEAPTPEAAEAPDPAELADAADAERGADRLAFFSDAVCAIAITLVVLPLIDTARDLAGGTAASYFADNAAALLAAGVSFITIALFWRDHHRLFTHARSWNAAVVNINLLWLAGVCFIPLATVIEVGAAGGDALARAIYVGSILVTMIVARFEERALIRSGAIEPRHVPSPLVLGLRWVSVALVAAALVIAIAVPGVGLWSMLLAALARPISALVRRRRHA